MKTDKTFLVLVPHRDIRVILQKQSESLIKNGLTGVYSFPHIAVLASLSQPLNAEDLKRIACSLREAAGTEKISIKKTANFPFPAGAEEMHLFGYKLDFNIPPVLYNGIKEVKEIFPPLIGSFLVPDAHREKLCAFAPECENLEFRAAAVANMYWKPVQTKKETVFKWKIDKLFWLPKVTKVTES